ncbi:MAG: class I SAM-dependent methyltransferase [Opitutaceae bacterium]
MEQNSPSPAPTERFSDRVENYIRYRPSYPGGVIHTLRSQTGLNSTSWVADVGSGTGIFAQLLLPYCGRVFGVEPNQAMRASAETRLSGSENFFSRAGTAEATGLEERSIHLVTAAQSFHWFDLPACRREFIRILRPEGFVALVWNERLVTATPFLVEYEALLQRHAIDYETVNHTATRDQETVATFYGKAGFTIKTFPNEQRFDFAGLKGRLLSSSYAPNAGHPRHDSMMAALVVLFERHQQCGAVSFLYTTKLYYGNLAED